MFLLILGMSLPMMAQEQTKETSQWKKHRFSVEVNSYLISHLISFNYEPKFYESDSQNFRINGRFGLGLGFAFGLSGNHGVSGGLAGYTLDFGKENSHFLLSSGIVFIDNFNRISDLSPRIGGMTSNPLFEIGWRYEKPTGGLTYKIVGGTLGAGLSIGYSF